MPSAGVVRIGERNLARRGRLRAARTDRGGDRGFREVGEHAVTAPRPRRRRGRPARSAAPFPGGRASAPASGSPRRSFSRPRWAAPVSAASPRRRIGGKAASPTGGIVEGQATQVRRGVHHPGDEGADRRPRRVGRRRRCRPSPRLLQFGDPRLVRSSRRPAAAADALSRRPASCARLWRNSSAFLLGCGHPRSFQRQANCHHETRVAVAELDVAMVQPGDRRDKAEAEAAARCERLSSSRTKRCSARSRSASGMPGPLSATLKRGSPRGPSTVSCGVLGGAAAARIDGVVDQVGDRLASSSRLPLKHDASGVSTLSSTPLSSATGS